MEKIEWLKEAMNLFLKLWKFPLFHVDQRPITVANIIIGLLFIALGYVAARRLTRVIRDRVLKRLDLKLAQEATIEKAIFYVLLLFATIFALSLANIPLTIFTLLGGAVAIGVGFGSQNVVNNFISGLILMVESPVKVGDIVELGELRGVIEQIGARATRIRSFTNTHIVVPNSAFLENNVINWTLADDTVLISVSVGVAYGSPTNKVKDLIHKCVVKEPRALSKPEPVILFNNFGDNSLDFVVYFGVKLKNHMERMRIESDMRFRIDEAFREAGITIAFPQRDVHIDSIAPLEVKLVDKPT